MRRDPYRDHRCADGIFESGWRRVKSGGRIKAAGSWYVHDKLKEIVGELVHIHMGDYWMSYIIVERGAIGCCGWYCTANSEDGRKDRC